MKKIYIILILVLLLSGSGIAVLLWFKKKKEKAAVEKAPAEAPTIIEAPEPEPEEEKEIKSKVKSEIPKELLTDISIDYVDAAKREFGYSMHYKGISHKGTFKDGDEDTFVIKSFGRFVVLKPSNLKLEARAVDTNPVATKGGAVNLKNKVVGSKTAEDFYNDSFVYLAIYNKKQLVTGLKVNLQTGEQIEGLPTQWSQLEA
ncbi:MAG: hypothetical protein JKY03_12575 [Aureispira sp.]|nr:hypothetical protein [Aureispira sp.]